MLIPAFTPMIGLSELVDINESTYWMIKNRREITTPILALERKTWMKKFCTIKTMSNKMKTIKGI